MVITDEIYFLYLGHSFMYLISNLILFSSSHWEILKGTKFFVLPLHAETIEKLESVLIIND